ncbi:glycosyltransferase [Agarivorans litoreus]|uniref:glycosyltransferase n=1 Tax=Agarivorans litoreus TaxID=1510455 RepID=UPI001C7DDECE|nr:glycosyltransferase [Agarivorans litoreus]
MDKNSITVVITPRDRYSGIINCIRNLYLCTEQHFELKVIDLDYPSSLKQKIKKELAQHQNAELISYGLISPIQAMKQVRPLIKTEYVMFLDNDSNVTANWLPPLLEIANSDPKIAVVNPVTLEKEGVDKGAELRNHLFTNAVHTIDYQGEDYLIEHKSFRRSLPEELPQGIQESEMFELHGVLFSTKALKDIELPDMVIREHIDIGIQLRQKGYKIVTQPESIIIFDNLGTRMAWYDMKFFFFRWHPKYTEASSRLFEERWGYRFYSEQAMYLWVFRRKVFLFARWLYIPVNGANMAVRIAAKLRSFVKPVWDPIQGVEQKASPAPLSMFSKAK